jgi:hypothetical protein
MMMQAARVVPESVKIGAQVSEWETHWPEMTAKAVRVRPIAVASMTRPGRMKRR